MKDILASVAGLIFLAGVYLLVRLIPVPVPSAFQFWSGFALLCVGTILFCAADPFFER
jgi:hypothetical protein